MANSINVTDLTPIPSGAITTGQQVTIYDQSGNAGRAAIEDVVSAAQGINGQSSIVSYTEDWPSATVLAAVSASPVAISVPRAAGKTIVIQSAYIGMGGTLTTPYDTNVTVAIRYVGADVPIYTCQVLDRTVLGSVPMTINTTATVGQTVLIGDADLEWYVVGGAALSGTGSLVIDLTVALI